MKKILSILIIFVFIFSGCEPKKAQVEKICPSKYYEDFEDRYYNENTRECLEIELEEVELSDITINANMPVIYQMNGKNYLSTYHNIKKNDKEYVSYNRTLYNIELYTKTIIENQDTLEAGDWLHLGNMHSRSYIHIYENKGFYYRVYYSLDSQRSLTWNGEKTGEEYRGNDSNEYVVRFLDDRDFENNGHSAPFTDEEYEQMAKDILAEVEEREPRIKELVMTLEWNEHFDRGDPYFKAIVVSSKRPNVHYNASINLAYDGKIKFKASKV